MILTSTVRLFCVPLVLASFVSSAPAKALTINVEYLGEGDSFFLVRTLGTAEIDGITYGGGSLKTVMDQAVKVWESLILDPGTLNIRVGWKDLDNLRGPGTTPTTTGIAAQFPSRDDFQDTNPLYDTYTGNIGDIAFDNDRPWFADATPLDHGEYSMFEKSLGDFGGGELVEGLEYTVPSGDAARGRDLFTTALHEIGHLLGFIQFSNEENPMDNQINITSGPFKGSTFDLVDSESHFTNSVSGALMLASRNNSTRRLVSEADLAVVAERSGFEELNWDVEAVQGAQNPDSPTPVPGPLPLASLGLGLLALVALKTRSPAPRS
ncbi:MAG: matrixin family metalloprotease [Pseudomonadota bacterium]